jgi:hypothetical protein
MLEDFLLCKGGSRDDEKGKEEGEKRNGCKKVHYICYYDNSVFKTLIFYVKDY